MTTRRLHNNRGTVLLMVLLLAALASLVAVSGLERARMQAVLSEVLASRDRLHEDAMRALAASVDYARNRLQADDFEPPTPAWMIDNPSGDGDYPWDQALPVTVSPGVTAGFLIVPVAVSAPMLAATGSSETVVVHRILLAARARASDGSARLGRALMSVVLPPHPPATATEVIRDPSVLQPTLHTARFITP